MNRFTKENTKCCDISIENEIDKLYFEYLNYYGSSPVYLKKDRLKYPEIHKNRHNRVI